MSGKTSALNHENAACLTGESKTGSRCPVLLSRAGNYHGLADAPVRPDLVGHARDPGAVLLLRPGTVAHPEYLTTLIYAALLQVASAVLSALGAQAIEQAFHTAEASVRRAGAAQAQATAQAHDLAEQADALRQTEGQLHNLVTASARLTRGLLTSSPSGCCATLTLSVSGYSFWS